MPEGSVKAIMPDRGFGFLNTDDGELFFHIRETDPSLPFNEQLLERRLQFDISQTPKGPRAVNVRPV